MDWRVYDSERVVYSFRLTLTIGDGILKLDIDLILDKEGFMMCVVSIKTPDGEWFYDELEAFDLSICELTKGICYTCD